MRLFVMLAPPRWWHSIGARPTSQQRRPWRRRQYAGQRRGETKGRVVDGTYRVMDKVA
ncbi:hypothetical protein [Candidatus Amarolinea dominans]|uniref:hypothetical protein n=1 Tax=Candidatus Amarolinea dominans TaxID=3140696 RepID=UPI001D955692|nr:hypothetical protein [Anaerolineae bacterium]